MPTELVVACPCGTHGCQAILRDDNVYEEGFNFIRASYAPEQLLKYGRSLGTLRPTNDDWAPTFPGGFVSVGMLLLTTGRWRVCVWGGDDTSMAKEAASREEAVRTLVQLPVYISMKDLRELGFWWA